MTGRSRGRDGPRRATDGPVVGVGVFQAGGDVLGGRGNESGAGSATARVVVFKICWDKRTIGKLLHEQPPSPLEVPPGCQEGCGQRRG